MSLAADVALERSFDDGNLFVRTVYSASIAVEEIWVNYYVWLFIVPLEGAA